VLIVEDLEPLGQLAATVLGRAGYRTVVATSGAEALELLADRLHVDLLLTDVVMPGMTGRELRDRLHEIRPGIPTIFMTGYTGGMLELGEHDEVVVISKPFTAKELVAAVTAQFATH
jgi:two-component system, cell cycle sensor histidine kinase and response regulator CckA